jgi:RNA polymerase sigma factor (sigma-70 family)
MLPPFKKTDASDVQLWTDFQQGDKDAFREIYERYSDMLLKYGLTIVNDRELIKDCIQDLFIELWRLRQQLSAAKSVKFYLLISLRRLVLEKNKKELKQQVSFKSIAISNAENYERPVSDKIVDKETAELYKQIFAGAIKHLPMRQQEAIFLRFYEGLEYDEIGKIMKLDYQVLRNTIYRAIKALRANIERSVVVNISGNGISGTTKKMNG